MRACCGRGKPPVPALFAVGVHRTRCPPLVDLTISLAAPDALEASCQRSAVGLARVLVLNRIANQQQQCASYGCLSPLDPVTSLAYPAAVVSKPVPGVVFPSGPNLHASYHVRWAKNKQPHGAGLVPGARGVRAGGGGGALQGSLQEEGRVRDYQLPHEKGETISSPALRISATAIFAGCAMLSPCSCGQQVYVEA